MNNRTFTIDPRYYGLPDRAQLVDYRIWDSHYHGFMTSGQNIQQHLDMIPYIERMGIERVVSVDIGGTLADPLDPKPHDPLQLEILKKDQKYISGIIPIDPGFPNESREKMKTWIANGPCIGIKYVGGNKRGITCDALENDLIIQYAVELKAVIYIHTWMKVGGMPARTFGANLKGESTPMDVVTLAKRFPHVQMICGHAGGDWELAARVIRPYENILFEFSGADPHSGAVDLAVKELGADRIVWGGHGPSRAYATEISKVLDSNTTEKERKKIFGENYRKLCKGIFESKGWEIKI